MSFIDYLENTDELVKKFNSTVEFVQQWEGGKKTSNEQKLEAFKQQIRIEDKQPYFKYAEK